MIEIHLYGRLRRFSEDRSPTSASIARVKWEPGDTVRCVVDRLGIPPAELGSNLFLNGAYATLNSPVQDADRLGLFPDDMQLLYKWYFAPQDTAGLLNQDSADQSQGNEGEK
jgi:hypothetical protein